MKCDVTKLLKSALEFEHIDRRKQTNPAYFYMNPDNWVEYNYNKLVEGITVFCKYGPSRYETLYVDYNKTEESLRIKKQVKSGNWGSEFITLFDGQFAESPEHFFMVSTLHDTTNITYEDFELMGKIYKKYSRIVRYGK